MAIEVLQTSLEGARLLIPDVFSDERGFFKETYSSAKYQALGIDDVWLQDNVSRSSRNVIRGMHGDRRMAKLVQVLFGRAWDVIVDLREGSPTYGRWEAFELSAENHRQLYIPAGFLHGFLAQSDETILMYKQSALYDPSQEFAINWRDPTLAISWPLDGEPIVSAKDANAPFLGR
jgi:dTDP-4-dehydrorhamnose 3,5-epimerase